MILKDLYFISQIIAAVTVVASLIFVGLRLRYSAQEHRAVIEGARRSQHGDVLSVDRDAACELDRVHRGG